MRLKSTLFAVTGMRKSIEFYKTVLGLHATLNLGVNVSLTGDLSLRTKESRPEFIKAKEITFGSRAYEIYFEESNFDAFI